jgi:hypothetical protein
VNGSEKKLVNTIWGKIERREMLRRLGQAGLGLGLGLSGANAFARSLNSALPSIDTLPWDLTQEKSHSEPRPSGLPYREIAPYHNSTQDIGRLNPTIFDAPEHYAKPVTKDGTPPVHTRRSSSWYDKPNGAVGRAILQYTNTPAHQRDSCAQAAVATLLSRFNLAPAGLNGDALTEQIYASYPPDVQGANSGCTPNRVAQTIQAYGMKCWAGGGVTLGDQVIARTLQKYVAAGYPCIVLLDMTQVMSIPGSSYWGHWAVAFAYDSTRIYLTNWDYNRFRNDWTSFYHAWKLPAAYADHRYWLMLGWTG